MGLTSTQYVLGAEALIEEDAFVDGWFGGGGGGGRTGGIAGCSVEFAFGSVGDVGSVVCFFVDEALIDDVCETEIFSAEDESSEVDGLAELVDAFGVQSRGCDGDGVYEGGIGRFFGFLFIGRRRLLLLLRLLRG